MESPMMMNSDLKTTYFSHVPFPYVVPFAIEWELEWFFQNGPKQARQGAPWDPEAEWSRTAYRVIAAWLSGMDAYDREVLRVAYAKEPRPLPLQRRLGRVTTVVVRLAALEAGWPSDPEERQALERRTATRLAGEHVEHGPRTVRRYVEPAVGVLRAAVRAYETQRGRGPAIVAMIAAPPESRKRTEVA
jgi:hypothetical protein